MRSRRTALSLGVTAAVSLALHGAAFGQNCANDHVPEPLLNLLLPEQATHTAVQNGSWFSPSTWNTGSVPDEGADVCIPAGRIVVYDNVSDVGIHAIRVDGTLTFLKSVNTRLFVDTLFSTPGANILIGTPEQPIYAGKSAEIVFTNNGAIDKQWDPKLYSRGLVTLGYTRITGADKLDFAPLAVSAVAGNPTIKIKLPDGANVPEGWKIGDRLVLAGTYHDPNGNDAANTRFHDEVLEITSINASIIGIKNVKTGLNQIQYNHLYPDGQLFDPSELHIYVANLTRNVVFRSEDGPATPTQRRGHVMLMHNPNVKILNAAFYDLGRSDKSKLVDDPGQNIDGTPGFGTNARGRYGVHFHRNLPQDNVPLDPGCEPAVAQGCVVWGSPGWGLVHHDSHCYFADNVVFDVVGAGIVAEAGNEVGTWEHNLVIKTTGDADPTLGFEPDGVARGYRHDFGFNGEGYWVQGSPRIDMTNNAASSAAGGGMNYFSSSDLDIYPDRLWIPAQHMSDEQKYIVTDASGLIAHSHAPVQHFENFEVSNSTYGLLVWGHQRQQGYTPYFICPCDDNVHRIYSKFDGLKLWNIFGEGVYFQYSSQIELANSLIAAPTAARPEVIVGTDGNGRGHALNMNLPCKRIRLDNVRVEGWEIGLRTPREGMINSFDGDPYAAETSFGLPSRASEFINLKMANNGANFFRRTDHFTPVQAFGNFLNIIGGTFNPPADDMPPVADFDYETLGTAGVVRFNGLPSHDDDTPHESIEFNVLDTIAFEDDNYIVAYAWDFDNDANPDAFGETATYRFATPGAHPVSLTVYDHQGVTDTYTTNVYVSPKPYAELVVDPNFNDGDFTVPSWGFNTSVADEGWVGVNAQPISGAAKIVGNDEQGYGAVAQIIHNAGEFRGEATLSVNLQNHEGNNAESDPPYSMNAVVLRVYAVNGEYKASIYGPPQPLGVVPAEFALIHEETIPASELNAGGTIQRSIDFGDDAYDYIHVGISATGVYPGVPDDYITVDKVSILGASTCAADINGDGAVNILDFIAFQNAFEDQSPAADCDGNGSFNILDFICFHNLFEQGCS